MIYATVPDEYAAELDAKTAAEPPPEGMAWSIAWDHLGRRPDLDALVPVRQPRAHVPAFPATLIVAPRRNANVLEWLAATVPDDLSVPGISDRLNAYLGTPNPERDA
jgi:hypothetical protein